ncbi:MAG TPA: helix-turn-helix domain-containing protein [Phytomonospora sp.]
MTDEQRVAQYRRADPAKMPRTPLGQQASVEGTVAALGATEATREHNRRRLAAHRLEVDETAAGKLRAAFTQLIEQYEADREAERRQFEAAEGTGLDLLAQGFREATSTAKRHGLAEQVGSSLPLAEAGVIRRAAKAVEDALPRTVVDARVDGWSAKEIAAELDVTPSYVYRILKENPWRAVWAMYRSVEAQTDDEQWVRIHHGTEEIQGETADAVASRLLDEHLGGHDPSQMRLRVLVWREGESDDVLDSRGEANL